MPALNPLTLPDPAVLASVIALDPATRAEERLQSLLHIWLRFYFSGTAFQTLKSDGSMEAMTFTKCGFAYQEDSLPESPRMPVIHLVMPDRRSNRRDYSARSSGHDDDWTIDVMVKVPASLTLTEMPGVSAEEIARRVGSELEWLLGSTVEKESLSEAGITRLKLERPSSLLPASSWQMRMLVFSCRTRREQGRRTL